jgi:hypothetical protein
MSMTLFSERLILVLRAGWRLSRRVSAPSHASVVSLKSRAAPSVRMRL